MVKNKKGWITVVEAFLAILLLMSLIFLVTSNNPSRQNSYSIITNQELEILKQIQINQTLRLEVLGINPLPVSTEEGAFPSLLKTFFTEKIGESNCTLFICEAGELCNYEVESNDEVYVKDILISSNNTIYDPRILKMVCYK